MAVKKGAASKKKGSARTASPRKRTTNKKKGGASPAPGTTRRKAVSKRKSGAQKARRPQIAVELKKTCIGLVVLVAICLCAAMAADIFINKRGAADKPVVSEKVEPNPEPRKPINGNGQFAPVFEDISDVKVKRPQAGLKEKNGHPVIYELFDEAPRPRPRKKEPAPHTKAVNDVPRVAIIIDDIGYDQKMAMNLFDLEPDITFSVLPWAPHSQSVSRTLNGRGAHIMLHLPMEPMEYPNVNPGKGALFSSMAPDVLLSKLRENLTRVQGAAGVNNHMGSRLTTEAHQMNQIFTVLKKEGLYFIDSLTAPDSKCRASARLLQIPFAERDVFLDNVQDIVYISGQLARLKKIAHKHGAAIGIGHPYPATLEALKLELPGFKKEIRIVRASEITSVPG